MSFTIATKPFLQRLEYFLKVSPKPELFISPSWNVSTVDSFVAGIEFYLEQCAVKFYSHAELLLEDIFALSIICSHVNILKDFKNIVTKMWLEKKVMLKLAIMLQPDTDMKSLQLIRRKLPDLFSGMCIDSDLFIQDPTNSSEYNLNSIQVFSEQTGIRICAVKVNIRNISKLQIESLKLCSIETLLFDTMNDNILKQDEIIKLLKNFHNCIVISKLDSNLPEIIRMFCLHGISFYLSRASTQVNIDIAQLMFNSLTVESNVQNETELVLLNKQRLTNAENILHAGYTMSSLSIYEKSLFLERLDMIRLRVGYTNPPPKRVAIFGSRSTPTDSPLYAEAREIAERIALKGYIVSTGGYFGIMEAGNRGAREGQEKISSSYPQSECVTSHTIFSQRMSCNQYVSREFFSSDLLARCSDLLKETQIVVVMPGTEGTLLELLIASAIGIVDTCVNPGYCKYIIAKRDPWERTLVSLSNNLTLAKANFEMNVRYFDSAAEAGHLIDECFALISSFHSNYL